MWKLWTIVLGLLWSPLPLWAQQVPFPPVPEAADVLASTIGQLSKENAQLRISLMKMEQSSVKMQADLAAANARADTAEQKLKETVK